MLFRNASLIFCVLVASCQLPRTAQPALVSGVTTNTPAVAVKPDKLEQPRLLRYKPEGTDFVILNGKKRFNRALYGTNTAFRVEAGDLPEFLLYLPNKGGNFKLGLATAAGNKWLIDAAHIKAIYRPGSMLYEIKDPLLGAGQLKLQVLAMAEAEGLILSLEASPDTRPFELIWTYGGASGHRPSRDGDIGADPEEGFYLHPAHCKGNQISLSGNTFLLDFKIKNQPAQVYGVVPATGTLKMGDAQKQNSPQALWESGKSDVPVVVGRQPVKTGQKYYFGFQNGLQAKPKKYNELAKAFQEAETHRQQVAGQVKISTPDPLLNTLGGALSIAADAVWDTQTSSYQHGAIAWRMPLNGWRGAYVADVLGWHDRARAHFRGYSKVQMTTPPSGPIVPDPEKNLARQQEKLGVSLFTEGYISRNPVSKIVPHHYDMNMVFIDELLRHFRWTGNKDYIREAWPMLARHLAWEKRNFDADQDGLYDAYASIWASDALQYSGGGVTHSSAYNYYANQAAAQLARVVGQDPEPYQREAQKIKQAIAANLWLPDKGWYAEYKDLLGLRKTHPAAGLWTVYHTLDSQVPDPFQAYQTLRYVDTQIPHIPIKSPDLPQENLYTLATTNWMPYTWSINNVALAEVAHTALAYWQGGQSEKANQLIKSILVESMYMGSSPGNLQQLSYYDHYRGELYRDFADGIGITSRAIVEGLFGIQPDLLAGELTIQPGLPMAWNAAAFETPDINYVFRREGDKEMYTVEPRFGQPVKLNLRATAFKDQVVSVKVNGQPAKWTNDAGVIGKPVIRIIPPEAEKYQVEITWAGAKPREVKYPAKPALGKKVNFDFGPRQILNIQDPQKIMVHSASQNNKLEAKLANAEGHHTFFVQTRQGHFTWWEPINLDIQKPYALEIKRPKDNSGSVLVLRNNTPENLNRAVTVTAGSFTQKMNLTAGPNSTSPEINIAANYLLPGTNIVKLKAGPEILATAELTDWNLPFGDNKKTAKFESVDLSAYFNDKVTQIFKNEYLSPRPATATLQLPKQGIGNWCYPLVTAEIDDAGLRAKAGENGIFTLPNGLPFRTAGPGEGKNILFTSQWDNYPNAASVPLKGKAAHAYLLMAGSTNPMQSRFDNGEVVVTYTDGSQSKLVLSNPETWWPIEQDYFINNYSFKNSRAKPLRVHLKTGEVPTNFKYSSISGFAYNSYIPGGAATVLDLPLDPNKKLQSLEVKVHANDVVIGLMAVTLVRD